MPFGTEIRRQEAERRKALAAAARRERDPANAPKDNATDPRRRNKQRRGPAENKQA